MKPETLRRVAVVDDETGLLELFKQVLKPYYEVLTFNSPKKFLDYISNHKTSPFEVLISDLKMPYMSGVEMIQEAQAKGFYFPSILLSGHLDKKSIFSAVDLGVYRLLEKPASPEIIIQSIEELIVEYDIRDVRSEIRHITLQLKETYGFMRLLVSAHIPETEVKNFALQTNNKGQVVCTENFDDLMNRLESRLDKLLRSENILEEVRSKRYKKIA
jgi:response regulator RpfG family c-di-GMP phosphodiesterase